MDKKKAQQPNAKPGVKFQLDQQAEQPGQDQQQQQQKKQQLKYKNANECKEMAAKTFSKVDTNFKLFTQNDPIIQRKDTASSLKSLLECLKELLCQNDLGTFQDKQVNYYITYNATLYLMDICRCLRKSVYSSIAVEYYAQAIVSLEGNIILTSIKYLEWRVKFYIELAHTYEELSAFQSAQRTVERCLQKLLEAKELEDKDPPLPDYIEKMFSNNLRIVRVLDVKLRLQSGQYNTDAWRKKLEEIFSGDPEGKQLAVIESLRVNNSKLFNTIERKQLAWKDAAVQVAYEMFKADADLVAQALEQQFDFMVRENARHEQMSQSMLEEEQKKQLFQTKRELDEKMIKEKDWKRASRNFQLEYHVELIHYCFEMGNQKAFEDLTRTALIRCKHRRIEVPYINDVEIIPSETPFPNDKSGYERINVDLNEANLRMELKKLRNKSKGQQQQQKEEKKEEKKEDKKKQAAQQQQQQDQNALANQQGGVQATEEELQQIKHKYLYIQVKRTGQPQSALFKMDIVMAEQNVGPEDVQRHEYKAIELSELKQYTGVQETSGLTPWVQLWFSQQCLKDEEEKKSLIVDIKPLFGHHPLIRPDISYYKLPLDLRQTPQEFIRSPNMEYVYLTFKTDREFFTNERELRIMDRLWELEKSYNKERVVISYEDEKRVETDLIFDIQKLADLIETIRTSLEGPLGEQFYEDRRDFLQNLSFFLWNKYFRSQLYQIEFVHQLRISEELPPEPACNTPTMISYQQLILQAKEAFKKGLKLFNQISNRNERVDVLWLCKVNLELCKLLEESAFSERCEDSKDVLEAIQNLRLCLLKVTNFRDHVMERGVESQRDYFVAFNLTCSNAKIRDLCQRMLNQYIDSKNHINKQIRIQNRKRKQAAQQHRERLLELDEEQEEEYEYLEAANTFLYDDNRDQQYFTSIVQRTAFQETEMLVHALHADVLACLFRCELLAGHRLRGAQHTKNTQLKLEKESSAGAQNQALMMTKTQAQRINQIPLGENYDGIADAQKMKTTLMQGETARTIKKDHSSLKKTLQEAGKLEPDKPFFRDNEQVLLAEVNQNPYQMALLKMMLAASKTKRTEQITLLAEALQCIKQAEEMEQMHIANAEKDAIFVFSTLLDNKETERQAHNFFPFDHLYKPKYIGHTQVPRKPVLVSRNSHSITLKLPPFFPVVDEMKATQDPNREKIVSMAIFGKVSDAGVFVSTTSTDLYNTGVRNKIGSVLSIKHLTQNEKYCFAVAAYDANEDVSNGIGTTGEDIVCLHPLPINLLSAYLAKIAYQIGDYETSEKAADFTYEQFTETSFYMDLSINKQLYDINYQQRLNKTRIESTGKIQSQQVQSQSQTQPPGSSPPLEQSQLFQQLRLQVLRIKQPAIKDISLIEIQSLTETLIVKARCLKRRYFKDGDKGGTQPMHGSIMIEHQKNILHVANFLLLAVETALCSNNFVMAKRICVEIYNHVIELLKLNSKTTFIFHIFLKAQMLLSLIPKQYWDKNLRILSAKYCYEIMKMSLQFNEVSLGKRVLYSETKMFNKKWYTFSKVTMVSEEQQQQQEAKKDDKKGAKKDAAKKETKKDAKKEGKGQQAAEEQQQLEQQQQPPKLIPKLVRELFESTGSVQSFLEDVLLGFPEEYGDYVQRFIDSWREQIEFYAPYVENSQEQIEKMLNSISAHIEYWDIFKDINTAYQKIQSTYKGSPMYMEICSKLFRRLLEMGTDPKFINEYILQMGELNLSESVKTSIEVRELICSSIEADIEWFPNSLGCLIQEKETNKVGNDKAIDLFKQYFAKHEQLEMLLSKETIWTAATSRFSYQHAFYSEINFINACNQYMLYINSSGTGFSGGAGGAGSGPQQGAPQGQGGSAAKGGQSVGGAGGQPGNIQQNSNMLVPYQPKEVQKNEYNNVYALSLQLIQEQAQFENQTHKYQQAQDKKFVDAFTNICKLLSLAAFSSAQSRSWLQLQNILKFFYNLITYEQLNPFMHKGSDAWRHLALLCIAANTMLSKVREEGFFPLRDSMKLQVLTRPETRQSQVSQKSGLQQNAVTFAEEQKKDQREPRDSHYPSEMPSLEATYSKEFWFEQERDLEVNVAANVIAYTVQVLAVEKKWNLLISITREFCNQTQNYFSQFILPFTIDAQNILLQGAHTRTVDREDELEKRKQDFENWKKTSKRRQTRQSQLTGEKLPEQIEFERDVEVITQQINLCKKQEQFIEAQRNFSQKVIEEILRDANQLFFELAQLRKNKDELGMRLKELAREKEMKELTLLEDKNQQQGGGASSQNDQQIQKEQNKKKHVIQQEFLALQSKYDSLINQMAKRQEKFGLAQAKMELGSLYYSQKDFQQNSKRAHEFWELTVDQIFDNSKIIYTFRTIILKDISTVAYAIGVRQMLIAANALHNLCAMVFHYDINSQREAFLLASELVFSVFQVTLPHPIAVTRFGDVAFRLREIGVAASVSLRNSGDIFADRHVLDPSDTLLAMDRLAWMAMDSDLPLKALPMLALMDYLATDLTCSSFYSMRAKIMRSAALAACGFINESYQMLQRAYNEKDLPIPWLPRQGEFVKREKGSTWFYNAGDAYNNNQYPFTEKNKEITDILLRKMDVNKVFAQKYGQINVNLLTFARLLLVFAINENEIFDENNDKRIENLNSAEKALRELLKKLAFEEELDYLYYQLHLQKVREDPMLSAADRQKDIDTLLQRIEAHFNKKRNIFDRQEQEAYFANPEESLHYYQKREERQLMIVRIRFLLHRISACMNLYTRSYFILKNALSNTLYYCQEYHNIELGEDKELEAVDQMRPVEDPNAAGAGKGGKGGKPAPAADKKQQEQQANKKAGKGAPAQQQQQGDDPAKVDQQLEYETRLQEVEFKKAQKLNTRRHLGIFWFNKLRTELCIVLYKLNKFQQSITYIDFARKDCASSKDLYCLRLLDEYTARIMVKLGKIDNSVKSESVPAQNAQQSAQVAGTQQQLPSNTLMKSNLQVQDAFTKFEEAIAQTQIIDDKYVRLMSDYGELLLERGHFFEAQKLFRQALDYCGNLLHEFSYDPYPQCINKKALSEGVQTCQELQLTAEVEEEILAKTERVVQIQGKGGLGGKKDDGKKGKDDGKGKGGKGAGDKKGGKDNKGGEDQKPDMKIAPLNAIPQYDFTKDVANTYNPLDIEVANNNKIIYNIYQKYVILYIKVALRYINSTYTLMNLLDPQSEQQLDDLLTLLKRLETMQDLNKNYMIPVSLRIELQYMFAKYHKFKFEKSVLGVQDAYIQRYYEQKGSQDEEIRQAALKYKKLALRKPHRDLCRNKYLIDVPNFSQNLKEKFIQHLEDAKKQFEKIETMMIGRGECLFLENDRLIEEIFIEIAEVSLLRREYMPRIGYKYIDPIELQAKADLAKENTEKDTGGGSSGGAGNSASQQQQQKQDINNVLETMHKNEKIEQSKLESEAYKYLVFAMQITENKNELLQNYSTIGLVPLGDLSKLQLDIFYDIVDADFNFKKSYNSVDLLDGRQEGESIVLFEDSKRKLAISSIDLLTFMRKLYYESKIFTFSNDHLQTKISRSYREKCLISNSEAQTLNEGAIIFKSRRIRISSEFKFIYILGSLTRDKIKSALKQEEVNKIIINEEKEPLYGNIYVNAQDIEKLLQDALDLRSKMQDSDKKSPQAKERDYKYHKKNFRKIINKFGSYFFLQEERKGSRKHPQQQQQQFLDAPEPEDQEQDYIDKYEVFIPDLNMQYIDLFINLFNPLGLKAIDMNLLAIFRYFHNSKYK